MSFFLLACKNVLYLALAFSDAEIDKNPPKFCFVLLSFLTHQKPWGVLAEKEEKPDKEIHDDFEKKSDKKLMMA